MFLEIFCRWERLSALVAALCMSYRVSGHLKCSAGNSGLVGLSNRNTGCSGLFGLSKRSVRQVLGQSGSLSVAQASSRLVGLYKRYVGQVLGQSGLSLP